MTAKLKAQISFAVTAKLISAFVFATRIVQFLVYLNPKFQASSSFLSLYRPVCVGPGRKPRRPVFSRRGSLDVIVAFLIILVDIRIFAVGQAVFLNFLKYKMLKICNGMSLVLTKK